MSIASEITRISTLINNIKTKFTSWGCSPTNLSDIATLITSENDIVAGNIKEGVTIFGVTGTLPVPPYEGLCLTAEEANSSVKFSLSSGRSVSYSTDSSGSDWSPYTSNSVVTLTNVGDKVYFKGNNPTVSMWAGIGTFTMTGKIAAYFYRF